MRTSEDNGTRGESGCPLGTESIPNNVSEVYLVFSEPGTGPPSGPPPLMADAGGPYPGTVGVAVTFDGTGSTGDIGEYSWDFGDGSPSLTGATVEHVYTTPGSFPVQLGVTEVRSQWDQF